MEWNGMGLVQGRLEESREDGKGSREEESKGATKQGRSSRKRQGNMKSRMKMYTC